MNAPPSKSRLLLAAIIGALVIWAGLLALGAFLNWGADQPHHDARKAGIVLGTMAVFLGVWGMALWLRARRKS
jgi:membrane protein DedA with SNARE-associated domain